MHYRASNSRSNCSIGITWLINRIRKKSCKEGQKALIACTTLHVSVFPSAFLLASQKRSARRTTQIRWRRPPLVTNAPYGLRWTLFKLGSLRPRFAVRALSYCTLTGKGLGWGGKIDYPRTTMLKHVTRWRQGYCSLVFLIVAQRNHKIGYHDCCPNYRAGVTTCLL